MAGALRKVFGAPGIVLKGSGFYKTDARAADKRSSSDKSSSNGSDTSSESDTKADTSQLEERGRPRLGSSSDTSRHQSATSATKESKASKPGRVLSPGSP